MSHSTPTGAPEHDRRARPHIVVVNGAPDFRTLLRELLHSEDYAVTTTNFVPATFAYIVAAHPDVLVIDLAAGQRGGWDLLEALHADAATAGIPVIVVSTDPASLARAEALADRHGAIGILAKPFDLEDMIALVATALRPA